jgi:hypothetical protein
MSLKKSAPPLRIDLTRSRQLLVLLLVIHLGATAMTFFYDGFWALKLMIVLLVLASMIISMHKAGWLKFAPKDSWWLLRWRYVPLLVWQSENAWQIATGAGHFVSAHLLPSSTCHASFIALNFRTDNEPWWNRRISIVIFPDAIDKEIFRQLRVRLRTRFVRESDN